MKLKTLLLGACSVMMLAEMASAETLTIATVNNGDMIRMHMSVHHADKAEAEIGNQLEIASAVFVAYFGGYFRDARRYLVFREENALQVCGRRGHEATIFRPYLNTRSWKSFW